MTGDDTASQILRATRDAMTAGGSFVMLDSILAPSQMLGNEDGGFNGIVIFALQMGKRVLVSGTPDVHVIVNKNDGSAEYGNSANIDAWLPNQEVYRVVDLVGALIISTP